MIPTNELITKVRTRNIKTILSNVFGAGIQFQDEGSNLGDNASTTVDFTGNGVDATRSGSKITVNIPGGGGSGGTPATFAEALAGTNNTAMMTPLRVRNVSRKVFNVDAYGAVHDVQRVEDGKITIGTAILTSVTGGFAPSDAGKIIVVSGAGVAGAALKTTILSYQSSTQVTLAVNASTTVGGAGKNVDWGTDDTAAIQSAINACFTAGGGTVYFPNGTYFIDGPLITSDVNGMNPNSQLYLPSVTWYSTNRLQIRLEGESKNFHSNYDYLNTTGVIFRSTLATASGTLPSVMACAAVTGSFLSFSTVDYAVTNIGIQVHSNNGATAPVISGLNLKYAANSRITDCSFSLDKNVSSSVTPASSEVFGLFAGNLSDNYVWIERVYVSGFKYGFVLGEHASLNRAAAQGNYHGITFLSGSYGAWGYVLVHQNTNHFYFPNGTVLGVALTTPQYVHLFADVESSVPGFWYSTSTTLNDAGNNGRGQIQILNNQDGTVTAIGTKTGGLNLNVFGTNSMFPLYTRQAGGMVTLSNVVLDPGTNNQAVFELGTGRATSGNTEYPILQMVTAQSGTSHVVGNVAFINSVVGSVSTERRLVSLVALTNGTTNTGLLRTSIMAAGALTQIDERTATYSKNLVTQVTDNDISPTALSGNTDNYAPTGIATAATLRISATSAFDLTGIAGGATMVDGRELILINVGTTNTITLKNDVTSTAANRFLLNADFALAANMACILVYDGTSSRWRKLY